MKASNSDSRLSATAVNSLPDSLAHSSADLKSVGSKKSVYSSVTLKQTLGHFAKYGRRLSIAYVEDEVLRSNEESTESKDTPSQASQYSISNIAGGFIVFQSVQSDDMKQDYLMIGRDIVIEELGNFMSRVWKLRAPEIVLSVISNSDYFDGGLESDVEDFQIGIVQAARLTKMWILTDGINAGVSRIIGEAIANERIKRKITETDQSRSVSGRMVAIGIVGSDDLWYGETMERATISPEKFGKFVIENKGDDSHELNPHHTHFLIMKSIDQADRDAKWNTRFLVESKLVQNVSSRKLTVTRGSDWNLKPQSPVVGLLVQGGPKEIDRVLWLLRKQIPVIVIKRKGYASGLLAYAYSEGIKGGDSQHLENIVKPQLMQNVIEAFQDYFKDNEVGKLNCRDKILECVKHAVQGECRYITILDPSLSGVDQKDLNKYILTAIFNAKRDDYHLNTPENVNQYLRLTLDWNSPETARREIVSKLDRRHLLVKDELFMEALLQPQREQFVELFLNMGFSLRSFMVENRVQYLYEECLDNDFFVNLCLENILHRSTHSLGKYFLVGRNSKLNKILFVLTGVPRLVDINELTFGRLAHKHEERETADRKALLALIYWAVLTKRKELAKVLWKRTAEPIAVALLISNMYYHMSNTWVREMDLKKYLKEASIQFGTLAIEMMDLVYTDSSLMAYYALINPLSDFNYLNVVDLALLSNNIFFIAHPCCQRSMRARWLGKIKIKSFDWGPAHVPEYVKIYLCLLLVFPMYFWLTFNPEKRTQVVIEDDDHLPETSEEEDRENDRNSKKVGSQDLYQSPPLWRKYYYLWSSPIAKFWINMLFIMAYLGLFALALMIPYCGNKYLNMILCGWTAIHFIEHAYAAIKTKLKYPTFDLFWPILAILADIYIVCVSAVLVIHQVYEKTPTFLHTYLNYTVYKSLLALGVIWVYFRALKYLLPVSKDLGPMLVNISQITSKDLINWLQLWMVCLVSGGIAIHAVVYPAQPFTADNFWRHQLRALLGIFLTEIEDLQGQVSCTPLYDSPEVSYTCNASSIHPYIRSRLENCPYVSLAGYLIVIQQLLITRHVFYTLMFAMFSVTTNRTKVRSVEIWKFQFYLLVTDFEQRSILPVPLTPITYPFRITFWFAKTLFFCMLKLPFCAHYKEKFMRRHANPYSIPYHQWKYYMSAMTKREEEKETHIHDILCQLEEDTDANSVMAKRLNERLVNIEQNQILSGFILESIINRLHDLDPKTSAHKGQARAVHTASRSSPYPGTAIDRFPVLEKDVSWEVKFESYDPGTYTKPIEEFLHDDQMWIDRDVLKLTMQFEDTATEDTVSIYQSTTLPDPIFNKVQTVVMNGKEEQINRVSSIRFGDSPLQYEVDSIGVPRNPMGRTGLRGRGNNWRWGPNHMILAVISRIKTDAASHVATSAANKNEPIANKNIEILVVRDNIDTAVASLPGGRVKNGTIPYATLCNYFLREVLSDNEEEELLECDQDEMIEFFSRFSSADMKKKKKSMYVTLGYSSFLVYSGYGDDSTNTDNAWNETEIWSFHYKYKDCFDALLKGNDMFKWVSVSNRMPLSPSESIAVVEAARIYESHN